MEEQSIQSTTAVNDEPKISFLEAFYGVIFKPKDLFEEIYHEKSANIFLYGAIAVFLSNLGKIPPGKTSPFHIVITEFGGFFEWLLVGLLTLLFGMMFKASITDLGKILGYIGLSTIPFFLLTPISLISIKVHSGYNLAEVMIVIWTFFLFCLAVGKSLKVESWRVALISSIPFCIILIKSILGLFVNGLPG